MMTTTFSGFGVGVGAGRVAVGEEGEEDPEPQATPTTRHTPKAVRLSHPRKSVPRLVNFMSEMGLRKCVAVEGLYKEPNVRVKSDGRFAPIRYSSVWKQERPCPSSANTSPDRLK